jgi:hypothetical protein
VTRLRLRTPKDINAAARWRPAPAKGWKYWLATGLVVLAAWFLPQRWALVTALVLIAGPWLRDKFLASPDLDEEAPKDGTRGTLTSSAR